MPDKYFRNKVLIDIDEDEALRMRESWVQHIFNSIEKLSAEVYSGKEAINNRLSKLKEDRYAIREETRAYTDGVLEKLKQEIKEELAGIREALKSVNESIRLVNDRISAHELQCLSDAKSASENVDKKIDKLKTEVDGKIRPVSQEVWLSKGKIAAWIAIWSLVAGALVTYLVRHIG